MATGSTSIQEILNQRTLMVKEGSCKTCQFCVRFEEAIKDGQHKYTHVCAIQGNWDPIYFTEQDLENGAHGIRCEQGSWTHTDACLAYEPKTCDLISDSAEEYEQSRRHREYMRCLADAEDLHSTILDVQTGTTQARLESLIAIILNGDYKVRVKAEVQ